MSTELPPAPPPPAAAAAAYIPRLDGTPVSALILARKQLDDDTTKTWLLVALCAVSAFMFTLWLIYMVIQFIVVGMLDVVNSPSGVAELLGPVISMVAGLGVAVIGPIVVVIASNRAYKRQYDWITAELVHGDMALMLVDTSYGQMIQEWREKRFQLRNITGGEVHLGETFALRLHHFAAYPLEYYRLAQGQREFSVRPAGNLNCWADGLALGCLTCAGSGCLAWLTVFLPLRVMLTYPKHIATRRAVLDYFAGKWDHALLEKYERRGQPPPAPNWG
jgi:hypothetical protein